MRNDRSSRDSSNASTASRSSRPRSARAERGRRALLGRLLRQGARFQSPGADLLQAAAELQGLGLIRLRRAAAVLCANPDDRDFPPLDPDCPGLIECRERADEGGGDYACPVCSRVVYPTVDEKERIELLTVVLDQNGIERFVEDRCGTSSAGQGFIGGMLVIPDLPQNRFICLVDFCTDVTYLAPRWSETQPCVYISVDPRARTRLGAATRASQVELVDLLLDGGVALERLVHQTGPGARSVGSARSNLPTGRIGASPKRTIGDSTDNRPDRLTVGASDEGIQVGGVVIECAKSSLPYLSFIALLHQFASDAASQREVTPLTVKEIAERLRKAAPSSNPDPESIQKALKRLDQTIVGRLREAGWRINEGDVIENVARAGKYRGRHGFRLNPDKVALAARSSGPG